MKLSQSSLSLLESGIRKAVGHYANGGEQTVVTDLHLQPNSTSGELLITDDEDRELAGITLPEWVENNEADFYTNAERVLANMLHKLKSAKAFDNLSLMMPYSFVLIDEDKETLAELLLVDDDTLLLNDELLKGLDEELDAFLKDLLEEG